MTGQQLSDSLTQVISSFTNGKTKEHIMIVDATMLRTNDLIVDKNATVTYLKQRGGWVAIGLHYHSTDYHSNIRVRTTRVFTIQRKEHISEFSAIA